MGFRIGIIAEHYLNNYGERAFQTIRSEGFDCADVSLMNVGTTEVADPTAFLRRMKNWRALADMAGVEIYQVHGPWPTDDGTKEQRLQTIDFMRLALAGAEVLGAKYMVVHPAMPLGWEKDDPFLAKETNIQRLQALQAVSARTGVGVAVENMPMKNLYYSKSCNLLRLIEETGDREVGFCLDTGHANILGEKLTYIIREAGSRLKVLHLHDNNGRQDQHLPPFEGTLDWNGFVAALREVNFSGVVSLETLAPAALARKLAE